MLSKKQLLATFMATATLGQALITSTGVCADVITPNEPLTSVTQKEKTDIPYVTLNSDSLGETITSLSVENNILFGTKTNDHSEEAYNVAYGVYSSNSPEFNTQTATIVGSLAVNPNDLTQLIGENITNYPLSKYFYIVDNSGSNHIPMVRINGNDLVDSLSF
ncbi:hypothetical protein ACTNBL_07990 [Enterococcus villorum]|uniref:hypothetical protein n=1 Tax=Enterococcus villorum TaxID=112904 RepID=UPI003F8CA427